LDAYQLHEARLIQERYAQSAVLDLNIFVGPVPAGKVWTIFSIAYDPSIAETRLIQIVIRRPTTFDFPIINPITIALGPAIWLPGLTEGMELKLFPGEYIRVVRDVATALSYMECRIRFVETDLPYYAYEEPLKKVIAQSQKHGSIMRGGGGGGGGGIGGGGRPAGGGGGGPKPI
jgi:uncharacterized membrane protein YgcG